MITSSGTKGSALNGNRIKHRRPPQQAKAPTSYAYCSFVTRRHPSAPSRGLEPARMKESSYHGRYRDRRPDYSLCRAFTRNVVNSFGLVLRATRATLLAGTAAILPAGYADLASAQTPRLRVLTLRLPEVESSRSVTLATRHPSPFWLPIRRPPPSIRCFARPRTATRAARPEPPPRTAKAANPYPSFLHTAGDRQR
jgi:hypothetical protein